VARPPFVLMRARNPCCCFRVRFERCRVRFIPWAIEERLPYGHRRSCQFLLLILILLMIFPKGDDFSLDQEHDQDQEQEGRHIPHCQARLFME
jgi:hypothetical protein